MASPRGLFGKIILLAMSLGAMTSAAAQTRDVAGAKDYPGVGRFGGSVITGYQVKDFDAARMQAAVFKDGRPADELPHWAAWACGLKPARIARVVLKANARRSMKNPFLREHCK